jgi:hypothetical protein
MVRNLLKTLHGLKIILMKINALKDKYARGANKKLLEGIMEVYPRPTFKANISSFIVS